MITYTCIIAGAAYVGLSLVLECPVKGFWATIWTFGALAFWAGIYVVLTA